MAGKMRESKREGGRERIHECEHNLGCTGKDSHSIWSTSHNYRYFYPTDSTNYKHKTI